MKLKQVKKKEKIQRDNIDDKMMTKQEEKEIYSMTHEKFSTKTTTFYYLENTIKICSVFTSNEN
jgi:hypothetical protein